jgi:acyl-coenzyme A synthetase/AMP-(fatty) acid ligase
LTKILEEIQCSAWLSPKEMPSSVEGQRCYLLPTLDDLLRNDKTYLYPYERTWEQAKDEIVSIIHTSGTTGEPFACFKNGILLTTRVRRSEANLPS